MARPAERADGFVRNDQHKRDGAHYGLASAFRNAAAGGLFALRTQRNMKIHVAVAVVAIVLGFVFRIDPAEWLAVIISIALVFAAECANTAIESVVDLVSPGYHELAKRAKDCAAAAVFVCALGAVAVEAVIILPRLFALFG